jgi:hypothetical protein
MCFCDSGAVAPKAEGWWGSVVKSLTESRFCMLGLQGCYAITVLIGFVTRRVMGWLMIELAGSSSDRRADEPGCVRLSVGSSG